MTPSDHRNELDYLKALVILMMKADSRRGTVDSGPVKLTGLLRVVPTLNVQAASAKALQLRKQQEDELCVQATQADDPWLLFLTETYVGKICFLHDIAERHMLYRVSNIAYWTSNKTRYTNREATSTLEPVHLTLTGEFVVADEDSIVGPNGVRLTKSKVLLGYILAQYIDGDEEEQTRSECVDLYIENAIEKPQVYLFKLQQLQRSKNLKGKRKSSYKYICIVLYINFNVHLYVPTDITSPRHPIPDGPQKETTTVAREPETH